MPFRTVVLSDGTTIKARISREAVHDWEEHREWLRDKGYLDRPPDVDTELMRMWIPHPDEQGYNDWHEARMDERSRTTFPVASATLGFGPAVIKCFVDGYPDGFRVRRKFEGQTLPTQEGESELLTDLEEVDEFWQNILEQLVAIKEEAGANGEIMVTDVFDHLEMEKLAEEAYRDIEAEYGPRKKVVH